MFYAYILRTGTTTGHFSTDAEFHGGRIVNFYNTRRIPPALCYQMPDEVHFGTCNLQSKEYSNLKILTPIFHSARGPGAIL